MGSSESTQVVEVPEDRKLIERRNQNIKRMDKALRKRKKLRRAPQLERGLGLTELDWATQAVRQQYTSPL